MFGLLHFMEDGEQIPSLVVGVVHTLNKYNCVDISVLEAQYKQKFHFEEQLLQLYLCFKRKGTIISAAIAFPLACRCRSDPGFHVINNYQMITWFSSYSNHVEQHRVVISPDSEALMQSCCSSVRTRLCSVCW